MTFTGNIPVATQSLGQTVVAVNNNFANYFNLLSVDHQGPNAANQGFHKQVSYQTYIPLATLPLFPQNLNQSYLFPLQLGTAGTSLAYQPSVVNNYVPVSPRAVCRAQRTTGTTWQLATGEEGPFAAGSQFNVSAVAAAGAPTTNSFRVNFSSPFTNNNYFVVITGENLSNSANCSGWVVAKDASFNWMDIAVSVVPFPTTGFVTVMVY
ncbi:MAG TPA: hypothetical protein VIJ14_07975 [Rhabdochlamydiaceae bacterium]